MLTILYSQLQPPTVVAWPVALLF